MSDDDKKVVGNIPISWRGEDTTIRDKGLVKAATMEDIASYADQATKVCGTCKNFQPQHLGQNFSVRDAFRLHVVKEAGWKEGFLCEDPAKMGRCKQDPGLATGPRSKACDHYRGK
jgi:hypothetical protein